MLYTLLTPVCLPHLFETPFLYIGFEPAFYCWFETPFCCWFETSVCIYSVRHSVLLIWNPFYLKFVLNTPFCSWFEIHFVSILKPHFFGNPKFMMSPNQQATIYILQFDDIKSNVINLGDKILINISLTHSNDNK